MRVGGGIVLAAAVFLIGIGAAPASAAKTPWLVGAAVVDTTPPKFDAAKDLQDFPDAVCPRSVYSAKRIWRFEEPYRDSDGSGEFDYPDPQQPGSGDQYCDYNHNGRWDGIYLSGGSNHLAKSVHDPIDARAAAFSAGGKTVVLVSVVAQGIFENYLSDARAQAQSMATQSPHTQTCGHIDGMVVSSNHNESSPDTVGLYGPADSSGTLPLYSGIDEYYMHWLDGQIASAAVKACDKRRPASLREAELPVPPGLRQEIPNRFPTTVDGGAPAAIDPKLRVLQARDAGGAPIFTMMNLADHNQDIGQSDTYAVARAVSSDWPGYFHARLEHDVGGGMAMFLAADLGSMEDPITVPAIQGPPCNNGDNGCYPQVRATGESLADAVAGALPHAAPVGVGAVDVRRTEFCVPIENNLFKALAAAGIFGERQTYAGCQQAGRAGDEVKTSVGVMDVGPALQFIVNPGESFPALILGGPWGIEDASCPNRANPPVPTWHASARYRFQVGLGDDFVGYLKPAWSFLYDTQGSYTPTDGCTSDPHNHHHGLEDESLGPTASNAVAQNLTDLLAAHPDPRAQVRLGRYVKADGHLTDPYSVAQDQGAPGHFPGGAVALWLAAPGSTTLDAAPGRPDSGTLVALPQIASFGSRPVDATGPFMDFDGAQQPAGADITTRGMLVKAAGGGVVKRYYADVYPALAVSGSLGAARSATGAPIQTGGSGGGGTAGAPGSGATPGGQGGCRDATAPRSRIARRSLRRSRHGLLLRGIEHDAGCPGAAGLRVRVYVSVALLLGHGRCRYLTRPGLGHLARCSRPSALLAVGGGHRWRFVHHGRIPPGRYLARAFAIDAAGNREHPSRRANRMRFRIR
jgi:hypothetical protein